MKFEKVPLVELIAEIKWLPDGARVADVEGGVQIEASHFFNSARNDELFMSFASLVGAKGYTQIERLVPPGFPLLPFQPTYRYREGGSPVGPTLYQLGPGIFSTNTTPPYSSWEQFRPIVEQGVALLVQAHPAQSRPKAFTSVVLRYIDAFTAEFTQGRSMSRFLHEVLGVSVNLPAAFTRHLEDGSEPRSHLDITLPLRRGMVLNVKFANGKANGLDAVIMDTTVSAGRTVDVTPTAIMTALDMAHDVIRATFVESTTPIHSLMHPVESNDHARS